MWRSIYADEGLKHSNIPPMAVEGLSFTGQRECMVILESLTSYEGRTTDTDLRWTFDLTIVGMTSELDQVRSLIAGLEAKASKRQLLVKGLEGPYKLTDMADRRAWLRLWVSRVWIDGAVRRGAGWDPQRVRIEWTQGEYEPTEESASDAGIAAWQALA